jgi:hypothetical protein
MISTSSTRESCVRGALTRRCDAERELRVPADDEVFRGDTLQRDEILRRPAPGSLEPEHSQELVRMGSD